MNLSFKEQFVPKILNGTKIQTIRQDKKNRWKVGSKIHFRTPRFSKDSRCFAEGIVYEIMKIEIYPLTKKIVVAGHKIEKHDYILAFVKSDGFESVEDFFKFFPTYFEGIVIYWKPLKSN